MTKIKIKDGTSDCYESFRRWIASLISLLSLFLVVRIELVGDKDGGETGYIPRPRIFFTIVETVARGDKKSRKRRRIIDQMQRLYRVTIPLVQNHPLTSEQKFCFGLAKSGQARPKRNFSF